MIQQYKISGPDFKEMLISGAALLERNKKAVDALNVFPVPDGDTGTNMSMTVASAIRELKNADDSTVSAVAAAMAQGALRGARGNSGVILSQLFRGFARAADGLKEMDAVQYAEALQMGVDSAYKAVMKPKEGTILTVARVIAEKAKQNAVAGANVYKLIDDILTDGEEILLKTPDMLPVLKEAGVVDAGGKGLLLIYRGFKMALDGEELGEELLLEEEKEADREETVMFENLDDIKFAYCTEFFIERRNQPYTEAEIEVLRNHLERLGDSVVVVGDGSLIKVHVHTNMPGKALQIALRLGELNGVKIENMLDQNRKLLEERKAREKEFGMVAVSMGEGIAGIFKDLTVDGIVTGGQTMNPSAADIEKAVKHVSARTVFVFPNNKNIVLAAQQASELLDKSANGKRIIVIPTHSIPEGVAAVLAFNPTVSAETNEAAMNEAAKNVKSGSVTFSVRSTAFDGREIREGDIMGMLGSNLAATGTDIASVAHELLAKMLKDGGDYITIFYGSDVSKEDAEAFAAVVEEKYSDMDVVLQYGGQPLYYYLFSVE